MWGIRRIGRRIREVGSRRGRRGLRCILRGGLGLGGTGILRRYAGAVMEVSRGGMRVVWMRFLIPFLLVGSRIRIGGGVVKERVV